MKKNIYSVTAVNSYIRNMFSQDYLLGSISVRGELSNLKYHSSGHIYFSLKDEKALLSCVMFASHAKSLTFRMKEGMRVVASGKVEVYERDGKYQLYASRIEEDGEGDLNLAFLQLKQKLEEQGLFAPEYKQPIPSYAARVGIVTAPTGAAVRDIINVSRRRNPFVQLIVYPAAVQGEGAAPSIVRGIQALERYGVDVIIVGRGGGSMEDLWAFNEEMVAQAIFDCSIPIISAVGHETDFTIADFVSDLRAPTPSAAAELAVADVRGLLERMDSYSRAFDREMKGRISRLRLRSEKAGQQLKLLSPEGKLRSSRQRLATAEERLEDLFDRLMAERKRRYSMLLERMELRSPLKRLGGGYVYVSDPEGVGVSGVEKLRKGDRLKLRFRDGYAISVLEQVEKEKLF
ncbi:MAG: exodeoxyribonuclease VII large subunit [Lachnospiraceae bacterium]|nr:exodeoxyribonuclease VII large subunit [Lachnospiraceae bacterium]